MPDIVQSLTRKIFRKIDDVRKSQGKQWGEVIYILNTLGCNVESETVSEWRSGKSDTFLSMMGEIACALEVDAETLTDVT